MAFLRWDLLDSYGLREKFKDLLYVAAKTPDAKGSKSNGSNDWWSGSWKNWDSGDWGDWDDYDWKGSTASKSSKSGKSSKSYDSYDYSYGYGSYSSYKDNGTYDYKDWSKASRSRSAPRGDATAAVKSRRSASAGTERSEKSAMAFNRGSQWGQEADSKEPTAKKARQDEGQKLNRPSGADLFKEAIAKINPSDYKQQHDDRGDEEPWIGGPGSKRREPNRSGKESTPEVSDKPLEGKNTDLERPFIRFTVAPKAEDVRPVSILRQAFELAKERWESSRDWSYVGEMLRSIRQDLTIQMVQDIFVVEVHEYWAQVALEFGDFKQFDQAAAQLEVYYADPSFESGTGKMKEVLSWRLLYLTVEGEGIATTEFLQRHRSRLDDSPIVKFAWRLRRAMSQRCFSQAIKLLLPNEDVPALPKSLRNELLRRARLLQLMGLCKALSRDKVTKESLAEFGLVEDGESPATKLPIVYRKDDESVMDAQATHDQAAKELEPTDMRSTTQGQVRIKRRLGRQHEDHLNGFMRAQPPREASAAPKEKSKPRMVD